MIASATRGVAIKAKKAAPKSNMVVISAATGMKQLGLTKKKVMGCLRITY